MTKTEEQINAEKASKPRPDLVPPSAIEAAGRAFGFGAAKHGTPGGRGTYRIAGTEQALVQTHVASFERHWLAWKRGEEFDPESWLPHLDCASAQLAIVIDLVADPPDGSRGGGSYRDVLQREIGPANDDERQWRGCP